MKQVRLSEEKDQQTILLFLPKYVHAGDTEKKAFANAPMGTPIKQFSRSQKKGSETLSLQITTLTEVPIIPKYCKR